MLVERILAFVRGGSDEAFEALAPAVFRHQCERSATLRGLCAARGRAPESITGWSQLPALPLSMAERCAVELASGPGEPAPGELATTVLDRSFPEACLQGLDRPPALSLLPNDANGGTAALGAQVLSAWTAPDSVVALAPRGVETARARGFLAARQRDRRPTVVLTTSATLAQLLDALERRGLRFRLPPASRVVAMVDDAPLGADLLARAAERLAVPADGVIRAWAAGGQVTRFYAGHHQDGTPKPFPTPAWSRVRAQGRDPAGAAPAGVAGTIAVFDLASLAFPACVLSSALGTAVADGFQITGPAAASTGPPGSG